MNLKKKKKGKNTILYNIQDAFPSKEHLGKKIVQ